MKHLACVLLLCIIVAIASSFVWRTAQADKYMAWMASTQLEEYSIRLLPPAQGYGLKSWCETGESFLCFDDDIWITGVHLHGVNVLKLGACTVIGGKDNHWDWQGPCTINGLPYKKFLDRYHVKEK